MTEILAFIFNKIGSLIYLALLGGLAIGLVYEAFASLGYKQSIKKAEANENREHKVESDGETTRVRSELIYRNKHKEDIIREIENPNKFHAIAEQIIPLLPLLGILGTVLGLFNGLSSLDFSGEITSVPIELFSSIRYALLTTVLGIMFSVILKIVDIVVVLPKVEAINTKLEILDAQSAQRIPTELNN